MSKLSQETIDRIRESASDKYNLSSQEGERVGYQVGATEWAERAQMFADFIQKSLDQHEIDNAALFKEFPKLKDKIEACSFPWINEARALLAKYKEVENG